MFGSKISHFLDTFFTLFCHFLDRNRSLPGVILKIFWLSELRSLSLYLFAAFLLFYFFHFTISQGAVQSFSTYFRFSTLLENNSSVKFTQNTLISHSSMSTFHTFSTLLHTLFHTQFKSTFSSFSQNTTPLSTPFASFYVSIGEHFFVNILQNSHHWIIHIVTIPFLFSSRIIFLLFGFCHKLFDLSRTNQYFVSDRGSLFLVNDRFSSKIEIVFV